MAFQGNLRPGFAGRIHGARLAFQESLFQFAAEHRCGHAARHFTRVVAAHAIGQQTKTAPGIGHDGIFVVAADHARIGTGDYLENGIHVHGPVLRC